MSRLAGFSPDDTGIEWCTECVVDHNHNNLCDVTPNVEGKYVAINVSVARKCQVYVGLLLWSILIIFHLQDNAT